MTVDVVSELAFGKSLEMLTTSENRWITEAISSYIRRSFIAMQYPYFLSKTFCIPSSTYFNIGSFSVPDQVGLVRTLGLCLAY